MAKKSEPFKFSPNVKLDFNAPATMLCISCGKREEIPVTKEHSGKSVPLTGRQRQREIASFSDKHNKCKVSVSQPVAVEKPLNTFETAIALTDSSVAPVALPPEVVDIDRVVCLEALAALIVLMKPHLEKYAELPANGLLILRKVETTNPTVRLESLIRDLEDKVSHWAGDRPSNARKQYVSNAFGALYQRLYELAFDPRADFGLKLI